MSSLALAWLCILQQAIFSVRPTVSELHLPLKTKASTCATKFMFFPASARNIERCFGINTDGNNFITIFEKSFSLLKVLEKFNSYTFAEAIPLSLDIMRALRYIQKRGFVHGDIQPKNILAGKPAKLGGFLYAHRNKTEFLHTRQTFSTQHQKFRILPGHAIHGNV